MTDIQLTGFEVISKLGEGGMAAVWKARQISLDRTVAIKILSSRFTSDSSDILRFQQEAQSAAKLKHPGIVQVYDANIENGLYFFVMEFVDGYTCADWLIRKGVLSEKDVLLIADCVSDALAYAWDREKIIHCDIKPDNIMIDEDGTVKVTDLGLSRTIIGMSAGEESEEILGTPAYMAPEQAMGEANQDCRLDMYALGAMMYHLSTGKLLFEDSEEGEVMEKQVNDTVENPKDLNPSLSLGFCKLVEVLMTKDKEGRPSDWSQVRDAISRVKKGHSSNLHMAEGMQSTVRRSVVADEAAAAKAARKAARAERRTSAPRAKGSLVPIVAGVAVLLVVAAVAAKIFLGGGKRRPAGSVVSGTPSGSGGSGAAANPVDEKARGLYYAASRWEQANKASYDSAIARYQRVVDEAPDSQYAGRAKRDIARLEQSKKDTSIENALKGLQASASAWSRQHQYDRAIEIYNSYSGPAAAQTKSQRDAEVSKLRAMKLEWEAAEKVRLEAEALARYNALLDAVVGLVTRSDFAGASRMVQEASASGGLRSRDDELQDLIGSLEESANMGNMILQSFKKDKGRQVTVQFLTGAKTIIVSDVTDNKVLASEVMIIRGATASVERNFVLADLSVAERLRRMGEDSDPAVAIVKGVMAYQSRAFSHARRYFEMSHHLLTTRLIDLLGGAKLDSDATIGQAELAALLKSVGVTVAEPFDPSECSASLQAAQFTAVQAARAKQLASAYKGKHERAAFYSRVSPVVTALMNAQVAAASPVAEVAFVPPPVDLPPALAGIAGNADKVVEALIEANPELGSEDIRLRKDDEGRVVYMQIHSSDISDISAVAALRDLKEFEVEAHWRSPAALSDVTALKGLPLERVNLRSTKVTDLTPLRGLPVRELYVTDCALRDLTPLRGMQLVGVDFSKTKVFDFMPLGQMPLKGFAAAGTQIKSLSFLRNAQLKSFNVNDTSVFDFSVLSRMPLESLQVSRTQFKMLEIVKNCPLKRLEANGTGIRDISILRNFAQTMTSLALNESPTRIFTPLKSLDLESLSLASTAFSDMALVSHMKLEYLNVAGSQVASLNGLDVSAIEELNIERTPISSIEALRGSPIKELYCKGSRVRNFVPVYDSAITRLSVDDPGSKWSIYEKLPALERVNGQWMKGNPQF